MNKVDHRTPRDSIGDFQQIVNIGSATAEAFQRLGLAEPQQLIEQDPFELYEKMCRLDGVRHDPCVLDVFMATIDYMNGNPPHPWWHYTAERKRQYRQQLAKLRNEFCNDAENQA
jgi:hypothetical protein